MGQHLRQTAFEFHAVRDTAPLLQTNPHQHCALHYAGAALDQARLVVLAAHGRYGVAADILKLVDQVERPDVAWIAPQATDRSWWGESFLAALSDNEPGLTSALQRLTAIVDDLSTKGFGPEKIVLVGFSQGACLVLEFAARYPNDWRGIVAMSGGLLGTSESHKDPEETLNGHRPKRFDYQGSLKGIPVHMGCHKKDPLIPVARVRKSKCVLANMGADVTLHMEEGQMHGILPSDIAAIQGMLDRE